MTELKEVERQLSILGEGAAEILPETGLREKLRLSLEENRPLRVKLGIDPTARDVHIGHMVPYRKLRQFQDLGHRAVLIIGDFTAMIGDPTGKNRERPRLSFEQVRSNAETYCSQIFRAVREDAAEVHYQSSWFDGAGLRETMEMAAEFSVAHLLSHETFRARLENGARLSLHELFYPLLQDWDSLAVRADIELGGMDQKFNILCGRDLQRGRGMAAQAAMFVPLLPGTDGEKMSKSTGNSIAILDKPEEIYGKVMSIADGLLPEYLLLACDLKEPPESDPYLLKKQIARNIVELYHGGESAARAEAHFAQVVSRRELPGEIPLVTRETGRHRLAGLLAELGMVKSASEGRRMIVQGGVRVDGEKVGDPAFEIELAPQSGEDESGRDFLIQAGKRRFLKLKAGN